MITQAKTVPTTNIERLQSLPRGTNAGEHFHLLDNGGVVGASSFKLLYLVWVIMFETALVLLLQLVWSNGPKHGISMSWDVLWRLTRELLSVELLFSTS